MRYLASALLTEGESDRAFLPPVLQRQLEDIGREAGFDVGGVRTGKIRTVGESELVSAEAAELLGECDLLMVHHDYRERGKIDTLRGRLSAGGGLVGVVPIREAEAWVLVARCTTSVFQAWIPHVGRTHCTPLKRIPTRRPLWAVLIDEAIRFLDLLGRANKSTWLYSDSCPPNRSFWID